MGQRADGKYGGPDGESYTKYGEKTSKHGHWEVGSSYAGTNTNGQKWQNQTMEWIEDDRSFKAPPSDNSPVVTETPEPTQSPEIEYSPEIKNAQEFVNTYEKLDSPYKNSSSQEFLKNYTDKYSSNIRPEETEIDYSLNLKQPSEKPAANKAALNFLNNKKNLVLDSFK